MEKKQLLDEIYRIHALTYGDNFVLEENLIDKISNFLGFKKIDEPKKADFISPDVDSFFQVIEDAANAGGLFEEKRGSIKYKKAVEAMQIGLILLGYELPKYGVDGLFGPETATAIDRFKKENRLPSDNTNANPETLRLLINQLKSRNVTSQDIKPYVDKVVPKTIKSNITSHIINFFIKKGLTIEQASGIVGNLYQESMLNPNAVGDNGQSYGLAQWRGNRLQTLKNTVSNWNTIDGQLNFIWYELNSSEKNGLNKIKTSRTPEESALIFAKYYERPGIIMSDKRNYFARNIYNYIKTTQS